MTKIFIDSQDESRTIESPRFYDAEKIQSLFTAFVRPIKQRDKAYNLTVIAEFLGMREVAVLVKNMLDAMDLIEANRVPDVSVEIANVLLGIYRSVREYLVEYTGAWLAKHVDVFVGVN